MEIFDHNVARIPRTIHACWSALSTPKLRPILSGNGCDAYAAEPRKKIRRPSMNLELCRRNLDTRPQPTPAVSPYTNRKTGTHRTIEKDCVRPIRFRTDAVTSSNTGVRARFRMTETRKLPGAPKAAERLRQQVHGTV